MSNAIVGGVYQTIIDDVINSSRVDFEESGVDEAVLEELRKVWQQKLSQLDVAEFPWDPKPEPAPVQQQQMQQQPAQQPMQQMQQPMQQQMQQPVQSQQPSYNGQLPLPGGAAADGTYVKQEPGVAIKQEPGTQQAVPQYQAYGNDNKNSVAASRAAQQLQAQYGMRAAGSINALQDSMGQQQPGQQSYSLPGGSTQQGNGQEDVSNGQTDGAGDEDDFDYEGVLYERSKAGTLHELGRADIDRILHAQIAARAKSMEGGGLMLPIKEATAMSKTTSSKRSRKGKGVAAFDGGDDDDDEDEEDDENAINSDLDDPEDESDGDDEDDDGLGHFMFCTYDKVQRVKNKWKCTLKDGVLTVGGKEYLFHKATGEYEW